MYGLRYSLKMGYLRSLWCWFYMWVCAMPMLRMSSRLRTISSGMCRYRCALSTRLISSSYETTSTRTCSTPCVIMSARTLATEDIFVTMTVCIKDSKHGTLSLSPSVCFPSYLLWGLTIELLRRYGMYYSDGSTTSR